MGNNYIYPHVNMTTKALRRRVPTPVESNATTLLAPFTCDRGPENVLVPIDTLADFENIYGELDYTKSDQRQILNIGNWLAGGGRVLACRITDTEKPKAESVMDKETVKFYDCSGPTDEFKKYYRLAPGVEETAHLPENAVVTESEEYGEDHPGWTIETVTKTYYVFQWIAKYSGTYYNNLNVTFDHLDKDVSYFNIRIDLSENSKFNTNSDLYRNKSIAKLYEIENTSELLSELKFVKVTETKVTVKNDEKQLIEEDEKSKELVTTYEEISVNLKDKFGQAKDLSHLEDLTVEKCSLFSAKSDKKSENAPDNWLIQNVSSDLSADQEVKTILVDKLAKILRQPLETEFDMIIDPGYPEAVKNDLLKLMCTGIKTNNETLRRDDAFLVLSEYVINKTGTRMEDITHVSEIQRMPEYTNVYMHCDQFHKVIDRFSKSYGKEVYVPSTYFLANLYPYNDEIYGPQYASAGVNRGVVKSSLWINYIPSNFEKNELYKANKNYIEKDSRGEYVMTELTYTSEDTALKFVNNSRSLLKMKKELRQLARQYLHEFNDRITKTNLLNALNANLSNWIQNRTLSYGSITLEDYHDNDSLTNEELLIHLDIKFKETIEVISIEFIVE